MRNLRNLKERNASCIYMYINVYASISKEAFASFSPPRRIRKTSRHFLNSIPSPLLVELLFLFFLFFFFFHKDSKSVPKAPRWSFIERDPLTFHYSKSRLRSSKDKNEISVVVAEQHFNLAYVLSNPIYINPLVSSIPSTHVRNFSRYVFSHPSFRFIPRLYTLNGGKRIEE